MHPFHMALPALNLDMAREFYTGVLGCEEKRSAFNWVDFDFFGHQLSLHLVTQKSPPAESCLIDGDQIPARHFGMILPEAEWNQLQTDLLERGQKFIVGPRVRFEGKEGEQGTMFIVDPFGNYLEFKYFSDTSKGAWY